MRQVGWCWKEEEQAANVRNSVVALKQRDRSFFGQNNLQKESHLRIQCRAEKICREAEHNVECY